MSAKITALRFSVLSAGLIALAGSQAWSGAPDAGIAGQPPTTDGLWKVIAMTCNGQEPNEKTRELFTGGNSISVRIDGDSGAFVDVINGCTKTIPLRFSSPAPDVTAATFAGPIQCVPAACDPACGLDLPLTSTYASSFDGTTLRWESLDDVDQNCTAGGQENPIRYTMERVE